MTAEVDLLREAAALMREQANAIQHEGRWESREFGAPDGRPYYVAGAGEKYRFVSDLVHREDADYIAGMDPAVALALAAWLDVVAEIWEPPKQVKYYTARNAMQNAAVRVAREFLRREAGEAR